MKKGTLNFLVNGKREVLREGDTLHLKAQVPHRYENKTGAPAEFLAIWSPL
jgi:quercetin dioxygenase-like cupin family protein